jgi:hypothetical protein
MPEITAAITVNPMNQLNNMRKTRFIWAIFSILKILATTDINRKGITTAFSKPKKALLNGVRTVLLKHELTAGARLLTATPLNAAPARAMAMARTGFTGFSLMV